MEDEGFNAIAQLPKLKAQNEALASSKEAAEKAKVDVDASAEQLKEMANLKKLYQEVDATEAEGHYL